METDVFVAGAGDNHAAALDAVFIMRRLQADRHFRPQIEWCRAAKFDAAFVDDDRVRGKLETGLPRRHRNGLLKQTAAFKFYVKSFIM